MLTGALRSGQVTHARLPTGTTASAEQATHALSAARRPQPAAHSQAIMVRLNVSPARQACTATACVWLAESCVLPNSCGAVSVTVTLYDVLWLPYSARPPKNARPST